VSCEIKGRDLVNGLPRSVRINSADLREGHQRSRARNRRNREDDSGTIAAGAVRRHHGARHCAGGGGALLRGFDQLLAHEAGIPFTSPPIPLTCVALGTGETVEAWDTWSSTNQAILRLALGSLCSWFSLSCTLQLRTQI
jgi:rod shape-determining protein MreB